LTHKKLKSIHVIESLHSKGVFSSCSCGGYVLYYTDRGVRCSTCGKVYGVWGSNGGAIINRANKIYLQTPKLEFDSEYSSEETIDFKIPDPKDPEININ